MALLILEDRCRLAVFKPRIIWKLLNFIFKNLFWTLFRSYFDLWTSLRTFISQCMCEKNCTNFSHCLTSLRGFPVAQTVKNPPAVQETRVQFLRWEDPLVKGMATHSSIFAWTIPMDRGAWRATVHGVGKSWAWLSN